jgi:IS4 transposase
MRICLSLFPWAHYRETKAAVKMHTLFSLEQGCPESIIVTEGIIHDKEKMKSFIITPGITYIFDRGYLDYKEFDRYCKEDIFFITRLKRNAVMEIRSINAVSKESPVLSDREVILGTFYTKMQHPLRNVEVIDSSTGEPFWIATNRFDLTAEEISQIYRLRWKIELFFKWIKQHLRIKKFYGTSYNAVQTQIYSALVLYILLKLMDILTGRKFNFLKLVRHIASGLWNTMENLIDALSETKPPGLKSKRFNWKREYASLLAMYLVSKRY